LSPLWRRIKEKVMVMSKSTRKATNAAVLSQIEDGVWNVGTSTEGLIGACRMVRNIEEANDVRDRAVLYRMATILRTSMFQQVGKVIKLVPRNAPISKDEALTEAADICERPGATSTSKPNRRTEAMETLYGRCRTWWSRFLSDNGLKSSGKGAGNKNGAKREPRPNVATVNGKEVVFPKLPEKPESMTEAQFFGAAATYLNMRCNGDKTALDSEIARYTIAYFKQVHARLKELVVEPAKATTKAPTPAKK
jgi:hypothetical protein